MHRPITIAIVALVLLCAACGPDTRPGPPKTATPVSTSRVMTASACAKLEARAPGIEECPPQNLVLDRPATSHGPAVTDADAERTAEGLARSYAIYNWAINRADIAFIRGGLISYATGPAVPISFGEDLQFVEQARQASAQFRIDPPLRIVTARTVAVSAGMRDQAAGHDMMPGPVALVFTFQGPYRAYIGDRIVRTEPSSYLVKLVLFGELRDDSDLGGPVWLWGGFAGCDQPWPQELCRE